MSWFWRQLALAERSGSDIFQILCHPAQPSTQHLQCPLALLESPYPLAEDASATPLARYSICAGPPRVVNGQRRCWTPPVGHILPTLSQLLQCFATDVSDDILHRWPEGVAALPFTGGWLGWLGYDLAWELEHLPYLRSDPLPFPVACWYEPDYFAVLDHHWQHLWLAATHPSDLDRLEASLENPGPPPDPGVEWTPGSIHFESNQMAYEAAVRQAKQHIRAGDIFQANLSLRFATETAASSWAIYRALQQINPSPFASYWQTPWGAIVSCSPERLVQLQQGRAQTRPIAGTRPRGKTVAEDQAMAQELAAHPKEIAEHIMLVDLERNDLGRICEWGSVSVSEFLTIERYSHVMHLVSNVIGDLKSPYTAIDLIRAMFPGGTITGCPKVRCMEIIETLEPVRRSLFYGSCGYLDWRGNLDLNILIRTLLLTPLTGSGPALNRVWGQVGAGIVADSDAAWEWHESLHKAQAQLLALHRAVNLSQRL